MLAPISQSFLLLRKNISHSEMASASEKNDVVSPTIQTIDDAGKRTFLKVLGGAGLGAVALSMIPHKAEALIVGSQGSNTIVGIKNKDNARINPATEESLLSAVSGQSVSKLTTSLSASGDVLAPALGNKIRVYASRFSLTADAVSVSFRFSSGGTDHEKYVSPKAGGLYGANNHPNYIEGGVNQILYCDISGTTTVQINIDYLEV